MLRDLLADPGLGLDLVAGRAGVDTRGPVRWAHISEIPDPTPWLEGGEVLLTTGLGVQGSPDLQRRLVEGLHARGCAGMGFGLGVVMDAVPQAMIRTAERCALPLFTVPYELPFIAVTRRVAREVFSEQHAVLGAAVDLHRSILAAVLGGGGIGGVIDTAMRLLPDRGWFVFDYYGQVLDGRPRRDSPFDADGLWEAVGGALQSRDHVQATVDGVVVEATVIRLGDQVEGLLVVVGAGPLHDHERLLLEQAVTGVSLELARGMSVRESRRGRVDDLYEEIVENRIGQRGLRQQLERFGVTADVPYRVLCVRSTDPRVGERVLCALVEDVLSTPAHLPVVGRYEGAIYCVVQPADGDQAEHIAAAARRRGWAGVHIGRSRRRDDLGGIDAAMREAAAAVTHKGVVTDVDALGLEGIIAGLGGDEATDAFVARVLGPVIAHDQREGSQLIETLRAYFKHGCRPGPAAAELRIHRHTLAYRLDRAASLTGRDLRDGDALVEVGLALRLHHLSPNAGGARGRTPAQPQ